MEIFLKIVHVFASVFLILVVLLQSGRGGGMGAAFGGASGQIFGGRGASSFLSRVTSGAAIVFFCTSLTLSMMSSRHRSVVLKSGMLPAHSGKSDASNQDPPSSQQTQHKAADEALDGASGDSIKKDVPSREAEAAEPKRADAPAATPPGVPTGE